MTPTILSLAIQYETDVVLARQRARQIAGLLEFELTETTLVSDMDRARLVCSRLKELGCRVAIDDFGTGYSSLAYLSRLPVDRLRSEHISFDQLNEAFDLLHGGGVVRQILLPHGH